VRTTTQKTKAYGLWKAVLTTEDGRTFTGYGLTEYEAGYRARRKAEEARRAR
jgi:hypothetical protein